MNNKTLFWIFLVLLVFFGLSRIFSGKRDQSFNAELIQLDTVQITTIIINPKGLDGGEITLKREDKGWIASNGSLSVSAVPGAVSSLLSNLALIKTQRIAAKNADKWNEFEVGEGQGSRVRAFRDSKLLTDFIVGRFSFNQQSQSGTSYVRLNGETETFAVDGFQTLTFGQGFNAYRDRSLTNIPPGEVIDEFSYQKGDSILTFRKSGLGWQLGELALDSARVEAFIRDVRNVSGGNFADDFDETQAPRLRWQTLTINTRTMEVPLTIEVYRDTARALPFVIHSNQNPTAWFESDSTGIYSRLFRPLSDFLPAAQVPE